MVCEGINKFSIVAQPWRHVYELTKRMIQHGNEVQILTSRSTDEPSEDKISGIPIIRVKKGKFLFDSEQLLKYLNDEEFDVVNWHGSDIWATIHIWRLRKKLKNNVILTLHSGPLSINDLKNDSHSSMRHSNLCNCARASSGSQRERHHQGNQYAKRQCQRNRKAFLGTDHCHIGSGE